MGDFCQWKDATINNDTDNNSEITAIEKNCPGKTGVWGTSSQREEIITHSTTACLIDLFHSFLKFVI